ncbi:MAG: DUF2851 family protein [Balneolaceae bacterium]|nr:DUF2851 family protein [Balneolaceae bacterium]
MRRSRLPYRETLLHWVWRHRQFRTGGLRCDRGESITVYHPGRQNRSDGPDFLGARLSIGTLTWHGDVELHWRASDWYAHGHHDDPHFNGVVLQVVCEGRRRRPARRTDGSRIPTLYLRPHLTAPLGHFLEACSRPHPLPCSGLLGELPPEVFQAQMERAGALYFIRKVEDTLRWLPQGLPPEKAWKHMTGKALFDGLGIEHNRDAMRDLFDLAFAPKSAGGISRRLPAVEDAGAARPEGPASRLEALARHPSLRWKHRGCRPANHPRHRIRQAAACWAPLEQMPLQRLRGGDPERIWRELLDEVPEDGRPGAERASILYATVFLPALYLLGERMGPPSLMRRARRAWEACRPLVPDELLVPFALTQLPPELYRRRLGAVYQLRHFCRGRRCEDCKVFQTAINP